MARLKLWLLGTFRGQLGSGLALTLPTRKAQALLAYLALRAGHSHSREKLATLLWGDVGELQARQSFRQALSSVRKAVGVRSGLLIEGETVTVSPTHLQLDVATFERRVTEGTLKAFREATTLYRGELLDGFTVSQPLFEEWLRGERERLRELALMARRRGGPPDAGQSPWSKDVRVRRDRGGPVATTEPVDPEHVVVNGLHT